MPMHPREMKLRFAIRAIELERDIKLKHSSMGSVKAKWAAHYGMSIQAKHDVVLAKMKEELNEITKLKSTSVLDLGSRH